MEVHFTPEQEAQLAQIATSAGTNTEHLVKDAALRLFTESAATRKAHNLPALILCRFCILAQWVLFTGATSRTISVEPGIVDANISPNN
jgi:hypothetical protein